MYIYGFIAGLIAGAAAIGCFMLLNKAKHVGTIRVDLRDEEDGPYMFLELTRDGFRDIQRGITHAEMDVYYVRGEAEKDVKQKGQ